MVSLSLRVVRRILAFSIVVRAAASEDCAASSYNLGGPTLGCCASSHLQPNPSGAGCAPLAAAVSGPVDVTFATSLRADEGIGGLASSSILTFGGDALGNAQGSANIASTVLTVTGAALPNPSDAAGASASAWVKCGAPGNTAAQTQSTVLQWANSGSATGAQQRLGLQATTGGMGGATGTAAQVLASPTVNGPRAGVVDRNGILYISSTSGNRIIAYNTLTQVATNLIGSGTAGKADGVGTSAALTTPAGITLSQDQQTL